MLIQNAKIWTGRVQGLEVFTGDLLLDGGLIKAVGSVSQTMLNEFEDITIINAHGYVTIILLFIPLSDLSVVLSAWLTPGWVIHDSSYYR